MRHRLNIAWSYALPFGEGRRWLNDSGALSYVFGGWQLNGLHLFQTGLPFTPTLNAATVNTGTGSRPDRIADGQLSDPTVDRWFDTAAFTTPAQFTYGNAGRNILYGPGRVNTDFSVFKEFAARAQFSAAVSRRVLQPLQPLAVRFTKRGDRRIQRRNDHQHCRHAAPDSVRAESDVLSLLRAVTTLARYSSPNNALVSLSKSVQVTFGSHVDVSLDQCRCGQDGPVKLVRSQNIQLFTSIQHHHHALFGCNVDLLVGSDW